VLKNGIEKFFSRRLLFKRHKSLMMFTIQTILNFCNVTIFFFLVKPDGPNQTSSMKDPFGSDPQTLVGHISSDEICHPVALYTHQWLILESKPRIAIFLPETVLNIEATTWFTNCLLVVKNLGPILESMQNSMQHLSDIDLCTSCLTKC